MTMRQNRINIALGDSRLRGNDSQHVIPAKAGISIDQIVLAHLKIRSRHVIPAKAGISQGNRIKIIYILILSIY